MNTAEAWSQLSLLRSGCRITTRRAMLWRSEVCLRQRESIWHIIVVVIDRLCANNRRADKRSPSVRRLDIGQSTARVRAKTRRATRAEMPAGRNPLVREAYWRSGLRLCGQGKHAQAAGAHEVLAGRELPGLRQLAASGAGTLSCTHGMPASCPAPLCPCQDALNHEYAAPSSPPSTRITITSAPSPNPRARRTGSFR